MIAYNSAHMQDDAQWRYSQSADGDTEQPRAAFVDTAPLPAAIGADQWLTAIGGGLLLIALLVVLLWSARGPLSPSTDQRAQRRVLAVSKPVSDMAAETGYLPPPFVPETVLQDAQNKVSLAHSWPDWILQWADEIEHVAAQQGINPNLLAAIVAAESHGRADAVSGAGAVGLMGVMPYGSGPGMQNRPLAKSLRQPLTNLTWGAHVLIENLHATNGNLHLSLAVYNGGWLYYDSATAQGYASGILRSYAQSIAVQHNEPTGNYRLVIAPQRNPRSEHLIYIGERNGEQLYLLGHVRPAQR